MFTTALIAWLGSNRVKITFEASLIVALCALVAGTALYVAHLYAKAEKYDGLDAMVKMLERRYDCDTSLAPCLSNRDTEAAYRALELQKMAATERSKAEAVNSQLLLQSQQTDQAIQQSTAPDGAVPLIVQQEWDRERAARGVK